MDEIRLSEYFKQDFLFPTTLSKMLTSINVNNWKYVCMNILNCVGRKQSHAKCMQDNIIS